MKSEIFAQIFNNFEINLNCKIFRIIESQKLLDVTLIMSKWTVDCTEHAPNAVHLYIIYFRNKNNN